MYNIISIKLNLMCSGGHYCWTQNFQNLGSFWWVLIKSPQTSYTQYAERVSKDPVYTILSGFKCYVYYCMGDIRFVQMLSYLLFFSYSRF